MDVEEFIRKWENCPGSERANYAVFLTELCKVLGVDAPGPSEHYRIDAPVPGGAEGGGTGFIDLYKSGHFILEAKQSKICEIPGSSETSGSYDELMRRALRQARRYAVNLPAEHPWPPFILVLDVGRAFEIYFDFAGNGRDYRFFPDRSSYRLPIGALAQNAAWGSLKISPLELLRTIWTNPKGLDPKLVTADVTRDIARRLASVSGWLESTQRLKSGASAADWEKSLALEETSLFLMRILFCMFAEDARLLSDDPDERPFKEFLRRTLHDDEAFRRGLADLWQKMGQANLADRWTFAFEHSVRYFNGTLFSDTKVYELARSERGELLAAAEHEWKNVEPAIFGTLLEQALTSGQRSQLGAHYTPRPYVERLVEATITEVLRAEWESLEAGLEGLEASERLERLRAFHDRLAAIVVLDPACGTGNFLYVAMEALLGLEGKVIQAIEDVGGEVQSRVGPGQFHGLEKNPRAAKIAELVLWIGWLRWRIRNGAGEIQEPVLGQRANINFGRPGGYDAVLAQGEIAAPDLVNPRRPDWPEADFIIGNPPFIGGKDIRDRLGGDYAEALWKANPNVAPSADFVMQWWDRAADILTVPDSRLRRFGFVTTNSITQQFSRRVIARHLASDGRDGLSLILAIPDHPWTKATQDSAAVRIAMTVAEAGTRNGCLMEVVREAYLETDEPEIELSSSESRIHANLAIGGDVGAATSLLANEGLSSRGVSLHGAGFIVTPNEAIMLGLGQRPGLDQYIRPYLNGRDMLGRPRGVMVIDLFGLTESEVRQRFPEAYEHLLRTVKPERDGNRRATYRNNWWIFGEPRRELRPALAGLRRYVATVETAKHRVFQFLDHDILPDNKLIVVAVEEAFLLGVLSSRIHTEWALKAGGWLGFGNDPVYVKSKVLDPFPFPSVSEEQQRRIADLAEELDSTRKSALEETPGLTMTEIYNLRSKVASGETMGFAEQDRATRARAGIVNRLHHQIDEAVASAYGWPADLAPAEIVARVVALNEERAAEETAGNVRWLRPDFQIERFSGKMQA